MSSPTAVDDLVKQAQRHVRHAEYVDAIELFEQALELDERRADLHEGLATACFLAQNYPRAVEHFIRVTRLAPADGKALINLGAVYNRMGEHQKAVEAIRKGLGKDRKCSQGYYNLGLAHRGLGQHSMAVSAYREAVRLDPQFAEAHQNLANVYLDMGNVQQAMAHYRKALEINPDFDRARRGLAHAEQLATQAKQSISPFGRLVNDSRPSGSSASAPARQLSDSERLEDRRLVHQLAAEIGQTARDWLDHLRDELEPDLLVLGREVAHGADPPHALSDAHEQYQDARARCTELRGRLRHKLLELRAHEDLMNTPDPQA